MKNKKLNFGVIGCGAWGQNFIRVLNEFPNINLMSCVDINRNTLKSIQKVYPKINVFTQYNKIINNPKIKCIVVSTPAEFHFKIIKEALIKNKNVLAEKPIALKSEEAKELVRLSQNKKVILMVDHIFLYNNSVLKLKELIAKKISGKIYYLKSIRTHLGGIRKDVNVIWDLVPHDISIFNYLLDKMPVKVQAFGTCYFESNKEDIAFINLVYPDNIIAHIHVSWIDANKVRKIEIIGSKSRIVFDDLEPIERLKVFEKGIVKDIKTESFGEFQFNLRDGDIYSPRVTHKEPLKEAVRHFINCVYEKKKPLTDGENAFQVVKVLCAIENSLKEGNVFVPV